MNVSGPAANVLVVDDDQGLLRLIAKSLQREGFATTTAASGLEAIAWLKVHRADLMLLDLKLQDIEGGDLIDQLSSMRRLVPFVIITGQGDERVAVEVMKRGALDYLVKDVNFLEFVPTVVRRALQQVDQQEKLAATEAALKKNRELLQAVVETTSSLIVVVDADSRIVLFNRACEEVTGYRREEVVGGTVSDLSLPPEWDHALRRKPGQAATASLSEPYEYPCVTKTGDRRIIEWRCTLLPGATGDRPLLLGTGVDVTDRKRLESEILRISDLEQQRIGQDLHDGICQQLAGIELMGQVLEQNLAKKAKADAAQAARVTEHVRETIAQIRLLVRGLSPVALEYEGIMTALQELAASSQRLFKIPCAFKCAVPLAVSDLATATHLYRIAQEAVNNAVKHSKAKRIEIRLEEDAQHLVLAVCDDGVGLGDEHCHSKGMGLRIMKYRAGMIGGKLVFRKRPNGGTTVLCSVQKTAAPPPPEVMI
ncbi:MAG: response regulator [Verrucomicrobia bacterium]|nr:response regulator [Verrucomicrobiota bacterium]